MFASQAHSNSLAIPNTKSKGYILELLIFGQALLTLLKSEKLIGGSDMNGSQTHQQDFEAKTCLSYNFVHSLPS